MEIEFDPAKDFANVDKHGVSLARTGELEIVAMTESSRPEEGAPLPPLWATGRRAALRCRDLA